MRIRYVGGQQLPRTIVTPTFDEYMTDDAGFVDVPDHLAASLLEQDIWQAVAAKAPKKES